MSSGIGLAILVGVALLFAFLNGAGDGSAIVATVITSRALSPRRARMLAAAAEFVGPMLFGTAVAASIGRDLVAPGALSLPLTLAALLAAIVWKLIAVATGIPSSSSHALVGGILGAVISTQGFGAIRASGLEKVLVSLFAAPFVGLVGGFAARRLVRWLTRNATPRAHVAFKRAQIISALLLALSHGSNDAQKSMGVITISLVSVGNLPAFQVPLWVILACSAAIACGVASGSWRTIRAVGARLYRIRPIDAFAAQAAAATIVLSAAALGGPVSTSHVVSTSVLGAGAAERTNKVRWTTAREIVVAWLMTIPITGVLGALATLATRALLPAF